MLRVSLETVRMSCAGQIINKSSRCGLFSHRDASYPFGIHSPCDIHLLGCLLVPLDQGALYVTQINQILEVSVIRAMVSRGGQLFQLARFLKRKRWRIAIASSDVRVSSGGICHCRTLSLVPRSLPDRGSTQHIPISLRSRGNHMGILVQMTDRN